MSDHEVPVSKRTVWDVLPDAAYTLTFSILITYVVLLFGLCWVFTDGHHHIHRAFFATIAIADLIALIWFHITVTHENREAEKDR